MELIGELSETLKKKFYEKRETRINEIAFQSVREEWKFTRQIN